MSSDEEMIKYRNCEALKSLATVGYSATFWPYTPPVQENHFLSLLCLSLMVGLLHALKCAHRNLINSAGVCESIYRYTGP